MRNRTACGEHQSSWSDRDSKRKIAPVKEERERERERERKREKEKKKNIKKGEKKKDRGRIDEPDRSIEQP